MRELEEELRIHSFELLLSEFRHTPKDVYRRTLLELTNYTGRRYEETISQLLAFFLDPKNEHGFGTLMINALLECLELEFVDENENIDVSREVSTPELKRIDLLVETESYLLVIENKIYAELYNDISNYRKYGENQKGNKELTCIVFSQRQLSNIEQSRAKEIGFKVIYYVDLFEVVKKFISFEIVKNNAIILNEYYVFLNDIIKSVHKKPHENLTTVMEKFLIKNMDEIDQIIKSNEALKRKVIDLRIQVFNSVLNILNNKEEYFSNKWWTYQIKSDLYNVYFLGYQFEGKFPRQFGIECFFGKPKEDNLIPSVCLQIVTWNRDAFLYYKEDVFKKYPNGEHRISDWKDRYWIGDYSPSTANGLEEFITALETTYYNLKEIIERKKTEEQTSNS